MKGIYILGIILIILIGTACVTGEEGETLSFLVVIGMIMLTLYLMFSLVM